MPKEDGRGADFVHLFIMCSVGNTVSGNEKLHLFPLKVYDAYFTALNTLIRPQENGHTVQTSETRYRDSTRYHDTRTRYHDTAVIGSSSGPGSRTAAP